MPHRILVIDDDQELIDLLTQSLRFKGFKVMCARNGREGLHMAFETHPDLIVLDLMMPQMDGWQTCNHLREMSDSIPVLILTALSDEEALVRSFELGVDDYMTKPFSLRELELRICALLRRSKDREMAIEVTYDDGKLCIDLIGHRIIKNGCSVHLTAIELHLLDQLVCHMGQTVPLDSLIESIWGSRQIAKASSLAFYINRLRKKIEDDPQNPQYILNEWGHGYLFAPDRTHRDRILDLP